MTHHTPEHRRRAQMPDMDETKGHVMAAGRELLFAAEGALKFCRSYVETCVPESSRPNLLNFFQKAITVADELSRGLAGVSALKSAARGVAKPLFTAMEREMKREAAEAAKAAPRRPAGKRARTKPRHRRI